MAISKLAGALVASSAAAALIVGLTAEAQPRQQVTGPTAVYWASAKTVAGFGAGASGRPSMMGMMMGGGGGNNAPLGYLTLQLGSTRTAPSPSADHAPPPGLRVGRLLPLTSPEPTPRPQRAPDQMPDQSQQPQGKIMIFWGCGEHAGPGQPITLDFARMTPEQAAGVMAQTLRNVTFTRENPPSPTRFATYGEWPNSRSRDNKVPMGGSLVGDHLVRGNYTPDIRFSLTPEQDMLAQIQMTQNAKNPSGSAGLAWRPVGRSLAYFVTLMGGQEGRGGQGSTAVMWTSSNVQMLGWAMPEYLAPGDIPRLLQQGVLLPPTTTACTIPQEVLRAAPQAMFTTIAYGPETNIAYPPRPANVATPWNIEYQVKVRTRSEYMGMLGVDMGGMGGNSDADDDGDDRQQPTPAPRPRGPFGIPIPGM